MLCGNAAVKSGNIRLTVALLLASTVAVTLWPPTVKVTVPSLCKTWALIVSVWVRVNRLGTTWILVIWTEAARGGGGVNQGSITFALPGVTPVTVPVNAAGQATATLTLPSGLPPGSYPLTVSYADKIDGHVDFAASSSTVPLTVNPPSPLQAALTIAIDTAALLLQSDTAALAQLAMFDQVFLNQSLPTNASDLLAQILAELPYAGALAGLAIQAGIAFAP